MKKKGNSPPSMSDVAKAVGVSQATVSYVLNKTGNISEAVTNRVLAEAERLGYIRNSMARGLKMKTANTIGIIVPDVANSFYTDIIKHTEKIMREKGYFTFICITMHNSEIENWYITSLIEQKVAGVLVCYGLSDKTSLKKFLNYGVPFVVLDDDLQQDQVEAPCVLVNNKKGSFLAVQHFVSMGLSKIAFCSESLYNKALQDRYDGFMNAIDAFGLKDQLQHIYIGGSDSDSSDMIGLGYVAAKEILSKSKPDGIFAVNDEMAIGVIKGLKENKLRVPQHIAVIGYDNVPLSSIMSPTLTTINQPILTMCMQGTALLYNLISGKDDRRMKIVLEPSLVVRESAPL